MKTTLALLAAATHAIATIGTPALAGGDKVQNENGCDTARGPGTTPRATRSAAIDRTVTRASGHARGRFPSDPLSGGIWS